MQRIVKNSLIPVALGSILILSSASIADPPADPAAPPVFCFRITDIECCPNDISGASFLIEFEVLNWTDKPACGLCVDANIGVFGVWNPHFTDPWHGGTPMITKAYVDRDGRGGPVGGFDIGPGVFDTPAHHSGKGRGDLGVGFENTWYVDCDASGHTKVQWVAGDPATDCIPPFDILGDMASGGNGYGMVPGMGSDGIGDTAIDGGPPPYAPNPPPFPPDQLGPPGAGGSGIPDGDYNVLDGFVIEVCDWHPGEILSLNWWLLDEAGDPLGVVGAGNAFGFGVINLVRMPIGAGPPFGMFVGNTGFRTGVGPFFDTVNIVPPCPCPPGLGPVTGAPSAFAIEMGAGVTAPPAPGMSLPFGPPNTDFDPNWIQSPEGGFHPCVPPDFPYGCPADLNGDGIVNVFDLLLMLQWWGPCN